MTYILKTGQQGWPHITAAALSARFPDVMRSVGRLGPFNHVESIGRREDRIEVTPERGVGVAPGGSRASQVRVTVSRSADDLHKKVRLVRDDDVAAIAAIDDKIERLQEQIRTLRGERKTVVKAAWVRGRQVPLRDVVDLALGRDDKRSAVG